MGQPPQGGNQSDLKEMAPVVYSELRRLARQYMSCERPNHTLEPTALVHEAYIRLTGQRSVCWQNRAQFVGLAANMMRRILINYARDKKTAKRGGGMPSIQVEPSNFVGEGETVDLLDLDRALERLGKLDPQQEQIVELRYFGGLSVEETAQVLEISAATVKRDWATARLFLASRMKMP